MFAPHADDETFGMGGSLLKASKHGVETHVIVLTDGALGERMVSSKPVSKRRKLQRSYWSQAGVLE